MKRCNYWDRKKINDTDFEDKPTFVGFLHPVGMEIWWLNPPNRQIKKIVIAPPFDSLSEESRISKLRELGFPQEFIEDNIDSWIGVRI